MQNNSINEAVLSKQIEDLLVARNLRGMKTIQPALASGYYLRAARTLNKCKGHVLIGTGFPVVDTFETDGPVGAIALYQALEALGATPVIVCGPPVSQALMDNYRIHEISVGEHQERTLEAFKALYNYNPDAVLSIERPGQAEDGEYYNMRGESISDRTACFDTFVRNAKCPTIGIGDGGNEIGMGNIQEALKELDIMASATKVDELLIADVSNWGAYGIITFLSLWNDKDLLNDIKPIEILKYLSKLGSVDGVTRENELTEDGLPVSEGDSIIAELRRLIGYN
ncbi:MULTISPECIES: DUF4392 domain-containing protein [unclassified Neptuniibacter]|jgi:hypothetical protein|uniref:DUF4392 domain-containing protein n=1 Tax=unclassified Neptuniibacter TaxID=2630693 RepID=UPI0026E2B169|nr:MULTISPECIES: DUF4392 domain-containing protein [unclassified Neptuniibacter]MDO6514858.1 DUF4392 domain-containing protein [Neptuniibacter sp. 2_MG-2023]MDO6594565.1 DUF4392 domain-containing protein [Neptuniibacter sp. 1_MG-2023]